MIFTTPFSTILVNIGTGFLRDDFTVHDNELGEGLNSNHIEREF
jgi:hypothetical protein